MPIKYVLQENNLTSDPDDYVAMVRPDGTADLETLIERIVQAGSTVTRADIYSVLEDYFTAVERLLMEGNNVNTPIANYSASIKGVFDGPDDEYDAGRHQLRPVVNAGPRLRDAIQQRGRPQKAESVTPRPNIVQYLDLNSDETNSVLTPGGMGRISGHRLKVNPNDSEQGIFFIAGDGTETRVGVVGRNKPGELMFMVPDTLTAGGYTLEVRAAPYSNSPVRTGRLDEPLTVS